MPQTQPPPDTHQLRRTAARLAVELHDALRAHGFAVQVAPEPPMDGHAYISLLDPLREDEARVLTDALRAYRASRRETLSIGVAQANARSRKGGLA
ncbi:hypothetical protein [Streptomyces orinoci]|uniref:Uncharacterized protein n=1 Tax=Streptomyces orinoci TaxID=67339 RepID=A0ABV3JU92_STRON|nr:hypothetical protein [Streptomyces orinoci]